MTFNEIEKEYWETFDINQGTDKINGYPVIKINDTYSRPATVEDFESFLKQSFIKYLQNEVKDAENKIRFIGGETYCVFCKLHRAAGECNCRNFPFRFFLCDGWNEAKIDQITHLQAQIKELEVS